MNIKLASTVISVLLLFSNLVFSQSSPFDATKATFIQYSINTKGFLNVIKGENREETITYIKSFERDTIVATITINTKSYIEERTFYIPLKKINKVIVENDTCFTIQMLRGNYITNTVRVLSEGGMSWEEYGNDFLVTRLKLYGNDKTEVDKLAYAFVDISNNRIKYFKDNEYDEAPININDFEVLKTIEEAQKISSESNKPILLMFTAYAGNARNQAWSILEVDDVKNKIANEFIFVELLVDDKKKLESKKNTKTGKVISTVGEFNTYFQEKKFNVNSQPYYVILNSKLQRVGMPMFYISSDKKYEFIDFLNQ